MSVIWSYTDPVLLLLLLCLLRPVLYQTWQQVTKDVMLMAGSATEALGKHMKDEAGSYLLTNGIWCTAWAALTDGFYWLKEHNITAVFIFMLSWQSGWRCREQRRLVTQRCRAPLNRWQESKEESGNGQQMEERSWPESRPEECMTHCQSPILSSNKGWHDRMGLCLILFFPLCLLKM